MLKPLALAALLYLTALLPARTNDPKGDPKPGPDYRQFEKKLNGDQEVLHALDRLTFGPRPGDVAAVKKMGLKKWIDLQLHPERIPESRELEKRLQPLESLRMTQGDTVAEYPTPQVIRAVALGKQPAARGSRGSRRGGEAGSKAGRQARSSRRPASGTYGSARPNC